MRNIASRLERLEQLDSERMGTGTSWAMRTALVACIKAGPNGEKIALADLSADERAAIADVRARVAAGGANASTTFVAQMASKKFFDDDEKVNR